MAFKARKALRWLGEAAVLIAIFLAIQAWQKRDAVSGPAPALTGQLSNGQLVSLADWRGQWPGQAVAVYFWAEWCPICTGMTGSVDALRQDWPVLTVAMQSGHAAQVAGQLRERGLDWPTVVDADGAIAAAYGLRGVPALIVVDGDGLIRFVEMGYTSEIGMRLRLWWANQ